MSKTNLLVYGAINNVISEVTYHDNIGFGFVRVGGNPKKELFLDRDRLLAFLMLDSVEILEETWEN